MINSYLQILKDSLVQKLDVLSKIEEKSRQQSAMLRSQEFSFEAIDKNMDEKAQLISELEVLDNGFEGLYGKIREELVSNKDDYKQEIAQLKELISKVTEKSASIQAIEARNKAETEVAFTRERKELQTKRNAMAIAKDYYQNMNKVKNVSPQFLDRKK